MERERDFQPKNLYLDNNKSTLYIYIYFFFLKLENCLQTLCSVPYDLLQPLNKVIPQHSLCHHAHVVDTLLICTVFKYWLESHNVTPHLSGRSQALKGFSWNFLLLFALGRTEYSSSYIKRPQVCFESFHVAIISVQYLCMRRKLSTDMQMNLCFSSVIYMHIHTCCNGFPCSSVLFEST